MFILIFAVPFAAALLCLGLNNLVQTRWLGLASAGALLVSAAALLLAPQPVALPERIWAMLGDYPVRLALVFDAVSRPLALLALGGGALALLALALAIPPDLRRFGVTADGRQDAHQRVAFVEMPRPVRRLRERLVEHFPEADEQLLKRLDGRPRDADVRVAPSR